MIFPLLVAALRGGRRVTADSTKTTEHFRPNGQVSDIPTDSRELISQLQSGRALIDLVESIQLPSASCYNQILADLQADCRRATETEQRTFALRFTKCFYNTSGLVDGFQCDVSEEKEIANMSSQTYQIFTMFKHHWRNMCYFAQQLIFAEETGESLIDLLHTMVASTIAIHDLRAELNRTVIRLNASISSVRVQVNDTASYVDFLVGSFGGFDVYLKLVSEFLKFAIFLIDTLKFYVALLIVLSILGILIPHMVGLVVFISVLAFVVDRVLCHCYADWESSQMRSVSRFGYSLLCIVYPFYLLIRFVVRAVRLFLNSSRKHRKNRIAISDAPNTATPLS
jgi:hypothetical protein